MASDYRDIALAILAEAAEELEKARIEYGNEDKIRYRLLRSLECLNYGPQSEHPTPSGAADIYVTDRQTVIEVKRKGKLDPQAKHSKFKGQVVETQEQQLHRYVGELAQDRQSKHGANKYSWWGILTDGRTGLVYKYDPNGRNPKRKTEYDWPNVGDKSSFILQRLIDGPFRISTGKPHAGPRIYQQAFSEHDQRAQNILAEWRKHWNPTTYDSQIGTKLKLWSRQLGKSGLAPTNAADQQDMFARHTFLVAVAKCVNANLIQAGPPDESNDFHGIADGFTAWLTQGPEGLKLIQDIWQTADSYEWQARQQDVLRHLYQDCIPKADRKLFGEFYTPDWLAEYLAKEICDDKWCRETCEIALTALRQKTPELLHGIGVLDPTCGSGTFLYHAALRLVNDSYWRDMGLHHTPEGKQEIATAVASVVIGIDVHPVAVTMAQATLRRALPAAPRKPLLIAQGDSLLVDDSLGDLQQSGVRHQTPAGNSLDIPPNLAVHAEANDLIRTLVDSAVQRQPFPESQLPESMSTEAMRTLFDQLVHICKTEQNSVWTWYITSLLHSYQTRIRKVDRILANPPWVTINSLYDAQRAADMKAMAKILDINVGGKLASSFDIAAIFLKRTWREFMPYDRKCRAAYVTNRALLTGSTWKRYRQSSPELAEVINLEGVREPPFTGARSAVAFLDRPARKIKCRPRVAVLRNRKGQSIKRDDPWSIVNSKVRLDRTKAKKFPEERSDYASVTGNLRRGNRWRTGPALRPHCLIKATAISCQGNRCFGTTDGSRHLPWRNVPPQDFEIPSDWLHVGVTSSDFHPFVLSNAPPHFIIPVQAGAFPSDERAIVKENKSWAKLDGLYRRHAGTGKHTPKTLLRSVNHSKKAENMLVGSMGNKHLVCYNAAGQYLKACHVRGLVADDSIIYYSTSSLKEAKYLTVLLNADSLQQAFAAARHSDRHFHTLFWRKIPIPRYNGRNSLHGKLVNACDSAEQYARSVLQGKIGSRKQDELVRRELRKAGIMGEIDVIVRQLLPDHTT